MQKKTPEILDVSSEKKSSGETDYTTRKRQPEQN